MKVLNAVYEGVYVYALLENNRILRSRPLDNHLCAEKHAEQVMHFQIDSDKLIRWYKWEETQE